jgi:hypothetical protein
MANESQVLEVATGAASDKRVTGKVALVNASGDALPAVNLPELPTEDGNYQLTVASGVYSWTEIV